MIRSLMDNLPILICMLPGAGLIILEVFLPGFGLPGISGALLIAVGTFIAATHYGVLAAVAMLLVFIALLALVVSWILHMMSRSGVRSEIFLHEKEELHVNKDMQVLLGRRGKTTSVLRPAGIADFDGVRLNVVTEGGFVEKGCAVEIIKADGSSIVVRSVKEN
ncbi:MAG: hypothetical protein IJ381_05160 [Clostridia bacterium]|nr:hypothetical protein [Clostridia bacterium]